MFTFNNYLFVMTHHHILSRVQSQVQILLKFILELGLVIKCLRGSPFFNCRYHLTGKLFITC